MKMFIYSKFGVLDCQPMTLQAIENSIPVSEQTAQNQKLEGASDGAESIESSASEESD